MNFTSAEAACQSEGATLATFSQLSDAQQVNVSYWDTVINKVPACICLVESNIR